MRALGLLLALAAPALAWALPDLPPVPRLDRHAEDVALVVGNTRYAWLPQEPWATRDAEAVREHLVFTHGLPTSRVLTVRDGTLRELDRAADDILDKADPEGTLWIYLAGHGHLADLDGRRLLLGIDAKPGRPDDGGLDLDAFLVDASLAARRVVVIADVGFAGASRDGEAVLPDVRDRRFATLADLPPNVVLWSAARPDQRPTALDEVRHGAFTWLVLGALRGWADGAADRPRDGVVTLAEAQAWVGDTLDGWARGQRSTRDDRPFVQDWPLVATRPGRLAEAPTARELTPPKPPPPVAEDALRRTLTPDQASSERFEALVADVTAQVQALADQAWADALPAVRAGGRAGHQALVHFLDRFDPHTLLFAEADVVVRPRQVREARRLLRLWGRPAPDLIAATAVEAGTAWLGSSEDDPDHRADEARHEATIPHGLWASTTEITRAQFTDVTGYDPDPTLDPDAPVASVSWFDALRFCNRVSALEGRTPVYQLDGRRVVVDPEADGWRLPTEAEWHRLAGDTRFPGADDPDAVCGLGNVADTAAVDATPEGEDPPDDAFDCDDTHAGPVPVGLLRPHPSGLHGLAGGVAEWVFDAHAPFSPDPVVDPRVDAGGRRVVKGGSWRTGPDDARTAARRAMNPRKVADDVGFRVVRTIFVD